MIEAHRERTRQDERVLGDTDELSSEQLDRVAAGSQDKDPWPEPPATDGQSLPRSVSK